MSEVFIVIRSQKNMFNEENITNIEKVFDRPQKAVEYCREKYGHMEQPDFGKWVDGKSVSVEILCKEVL